MEEKQNLIIFSGIKAAATTALLFGAAIKIAEINELPNMWWIFTVLTIMVVSCFGMWFYITGLAKKGAIDFKYNCLKSLIQTFTIDWEDNAGILTKSWIKSSIIGICFLVNILLIIDINYPIIIAPIGGLAFVYMARQENKPTKYFIMGYIVGMGSLLCGLLIAYLTTMFGPFLVWGFILTDATIRKSVV